MLRKDDLYWIWFSGIDGIGAKTQNILLHEFKNAKNIWYAEEDAIKEYLTRIKYGKKDIINRIYDKKYKDKAKYDYEKIEKTGIRIINIYDKDYPKDLLHYDDSPPSLYIKGVLSNQDIKIAVVGTRNCTDYGRKAAQIISEFLAGKGITVVSGLAEGIDTYAHKAALKIKGNTVAVLGAGHNNIYPLSNKRLFYEIGETGAILSEYLPDMKPLRGNFPARNRIISGISEAVIIVESKRKGGALITAEFAANQGKTVFAVPGNVTSLKSEGTNMLIKDGAVILTNPEDILEELGMVSCAPAENFTEDSAEAKKDFAGCDEDELKIIEMLSYKQMHLDELLSGMNLDISVLSLKLMKMEMKHIIKQDTHGKYLLD